VARARAGTPAAILRAGPDAVKGHCLDGEGGQSGGATRERSLRAIGPARIRIAVPLRGEWKPVVLLLFSGSCGPLPLPALPCPAALHRPISSVGGKDRRTEPVRQGASAPSGQLQTELTCGRRYAMTLLRAVRSVRSRPAMAALLVVAVVLVVAEGGPLSHRHRAPGAAVYDERCVLASLDSLHVDMVLPAAVESARPAALARTVWPPRPGVCPSPVPLAGSRSPPAS
jgi:hypothetical protein